MMPERTLHRIGAGAAMLGAVVALIFNLLHPRISDFANPTQALLDEVAASDAWTPIHVMLLFGSLLVILGLFVFARVLTERAGSWARLALGTLVVSAAVVVVTLSVDGYAVKQAADSIAGAQAGPPQAAAVAAGFAVEHISWALFMFLILTFLGLTPVAYGLAVRADGSWPYYFGWPIVVLGLASIVEALVGTLDGASEGFFLAFTVTSLLLTAWVFAAGAVLWRRLGVPAATAPARRRPPAKRPAARRTRG